MPYEQMMLFTQHAELGLSLDKNTNINYKLSLPNKIFDYIHAGVPILASKIKEVEDVITKHKIGLFIDNHEPKHIAQQIKRALDENLKFKYQKNIKNAALQFNWENEEKSCRSLQELQNKELHIVSLNIPFPANYGGAIDIYYKIKELSKLGIKSTYTVSNTVETKLKTEFIMLICSILSQKKQMERSFSKTPFIVKSRKSNKLLENLSRVEAPILFEGLHTCYYLNHPKLKQKQFVRAHTT